MAQREETKIGPSHVGREITTKEAEEQSSGANVARPEEGKAGRAGGHGEGVARQQRSVDRGVRDAEIAERELADRSEETEARERRIKIKFDGDRRALLLDLSCPCRLRCSHAGISRIPNKPSAAGWGSPAGTVPDKPEPKRLDNTEDHDSLPPLEELFGELQSDDYIERLEELAESLLREVTAEVEASSCRTNEQVAIKQDTAEEPNDPEGMVGSAPENVEAGPAVESLSYPQAQQIASPAAARLASPPSCTKTRASIRSTTSSDLSIQRRLSSVKKIPSAKKISKNYENFKREIEVKEEPSNDMDTVYGTYDEATNCITIIYPGEDDRVRIQECVQEITSSDNSVHDESSSIKKSLNNSTNGNYLMSPAYTFADSISSPSSINSEDSDGGISGSYKLESSLSDCGYESHDSPAQPRTIVCNEKNFNVPPSAGSVGNVALTDLWHESFSELFPSLA